MKNLWLYLVTVICYLYLWWMIDPVFGEVLLQRIGLLAILCIPFNIDGNVFTVIGNVTSEKNIYSICSLYQKAEITAFNIIGLGGYQDADIDSAVTIFGFIGYQRGNGAILFLGIAGYQQGIGDFRKVMNCFGFTVFQKTQSEAGLIFGLVLFQQAEQGAHVWAGLVLYQRAGNQVVGYKKREFASFSSLIANESI